MSVSFLEAFALYGVVVSSAAVVLVAGRTVPVVGVGDLLLPVAFHVSLRALGRGRALTGAVLCRGLLVALAVGLSRGGVFGIPFMAVGVLVLARPWDWDRTPSPRGR